MIGELALSQDPFTLARPDPAPFFSKVFAALAEACRVCRECGLGSRWGQVDRTATFLHYRGQLKPPDAADVVFSYGCHLLDLGFQGDLREKDITAAWENPVLRNGLTIVPGILLRGMAGRQRIEFNPDSDAAPEQARPLSMTGNKAMAQSARTQAFFSYSHKDRKWLDRFLTVLKPAVQGDMLWDDSKIAAGARWKEEIQRALASAKVAALLVSPGFLASDFIANHELPPLLHAAEHEGLTILWIPVKPSMYQATAVADFQAAHDPAKPLSSLPRPRQDEAIVAICQKIKEALVASPKSNPQ